MNLDFYKLFNTRKRPAIVQDVARSDDMPTPVLYLLYRFAVSPSLVAFKPGIVGRLYEHYIFASSPKTVHVQVPRDLCATARGGERVLRWLLA